MPNIDLTADEITFHEEEAQKILKRILDGMGVSATIESFHRDDRLVLNAICAPDDSMVIGRRGKTLEAIQLIVNRIVNRKSTVKKPILVDVGGYKERRQRNLIDLARRSAKRVQETGYQVIVGPYNAYERHVIHTSLKEDSPVATESIGEGDLKKIIFKIRAQEDQPAIGD